MARLAASRTAVAVSLLRANAGIARLGLAPSKRRRTTADDERSGNYRARSVFEAGSVGTCRHGVRKRGVDEVAALTRR